MNSRIDSVVVSTLVLALAATTPAPAAALGPSQTGQPNQTCGSATAPNTPGQSAMAPGSAFNPNGKAGTVYAGEQPQNSKNTASVSQYDVACFRQPSVSGGLEAGDVLPF